MSDCTHKQTAIPVPPPLQSSTEDFTSLSFSDVLKLKRKVISDANKIIDTSPTPDQT